MIVDARNVLRSRWPNLREDWFLDRVSAWAERERVHVLVVFDGTAPDRSLDDDERVAVVGTGSEIADDWIAARAPTLARGRPLRLVTSDRELRRRVEPHAERTIGGGTFAGALEDL